MKHTIISALIGGIVAVMMMGVLWPMPLSGTNNVVEIETAYDRVMRTNELKCGIMPWAPYWEVNANTGDVTGMARDFFDGVGKLAQLKMTYIPITFGNQSLELSTGRIDAVCNDGPWILSLAKVTAFTTPYYYTPMYVYVRADDDRFKTYNDLNRAGVTFVALDGDSSLELAEDLFPAATTRTISGQSDSTNQIMDVITKKVDATIIDALSAGVYNEHNNKKLKRLMNHPVAAYPGGMSVLPAEEKLRQFLSTAINSANATGLTTRVLDQYDPKGDFLLRVSPGYLLAH